MKWYLSNVDYLAPTVFNQASIDSSCSTVFPPRLLWTSRVFAIFQGREVDYEITDCLNEAESTRPCRNDRLALRYLLENSQKVGVLVVGWDKEQGLSLYSERSRSSQIGAKSGDSQSLLTASCSSSLPTQTRMLGR